MSQDEVDDGASSSGTVDSGSKSAQVNDPSDVLRESSAALFPFLEFRLVNDHANQQRAVLNARANAMVQLSAEDADKRRDRRGLSQRQESNPVFRDYIMVAPTDGKRPVSPTIYDDDGIGRAMVVQETDHDEQGGGPEGRVYYPLELEPSEHPYFQRVWYLRHTLNGHSPLLNQSTRRKIKKDGGWDARNHRYQDILASLSNFHRIRIVFKGTSAVSNSLVFAQKVYTMEDIYVGWQFGQIFYKKERWRWFHTLLRTPERKQKEGGDCDSEHLMLDKRLIHDIVPQQGGGQEPIE